MKRFDLHNIFPIVKVCLAMSFIVLSVSCDNQDQPNPNNPADNNGQTNQGAAPRRDSSLLLYAVASNNLESALESDLSEIISAADNIDMDNNDIYVYFVDNKRQPALYRLSPATTDDEAKYVTVKEYDRTVYSTDPKRIGEVINEYLRLSNSETRGIIFWSHGTGWLPYFGDHIVEDNNSKAKVIHKSFGWDTYNDKTDQCDIIEFADAIPDNKFDYIWFDCCYMGSIEIACQLRNKARYMVAYPTEVWGDGMQYNLTIPHLAKKSPDLIAAAKAFADYYIAQDLAVTVGIYDLSEIYDVARVTAGRYDNEMPPRFLLLNYGRGAYRFYDFAQMMKSKVFDKPDSWSQSSFDTAMQAYDDAAMQEAMSDFVIYKQTHNKNFYHQKFNTEYFSGISAHYFVDEDNENDDYYKQLDWYHAVTNR